MHLYVRVSFFNFLHCLHSDKRFLVFHIKKEGQTSPLTKLPLSTSQCFPFTYKTLFHMLPEIEMT